MTSVTRACAALLVAVVFFRAGSAPIAPFDSYSHWKYGQWIWENRRLPTHEPFSPFSDKTIPLMDTRWLAQVLYYLAESRGGLEGVSLLHAVLESAKAVLLLLAVRRVSGSLGVAVASVAVLEVLAAPLFGLVQVRTPAEVCFAALLLLLSSPRPSRAALVLAPAVVALWANLHESFVVAIVLLGGLIGPRWLRGRWDLGLKRLSLIGVLAALASLANPHGIGLWTVFDRQSLFGIGPHTWGDLFPVHSWDGRAFLASGVLLLFTLRLSPRRLALWEVAVMTLFALGAWYDKRFLVWWLMLCPWLLAPHGQAIVAQLTEGVTIRRDGLRIGCTVAAAGKAVVLVLLSPAVSWARGVPLAAEARLSRTSAYALTERLKEEVGPKRVFCAPYLWGDYLLWRLPADDQLYWYGQPEGFARSNRQDAAVLIADPASAEGQNVLRKVDTVVVSAAAAPALYDYVKEDGPRQGWEILADDGGGLLAVRRAGLAGGR